MHLAVRKRARYEIIGHHLSVSSLFCHLRINEKKYIAEFEKERKTQNLIKKVRVKVTHAGGCEERRGSVNERGGCRKVSEIERGRVLDGVMSSHMQLKQIEHQTEA